MQSQPFNRSQWEKQHKKSMIYQDFIMEYLAKQEGLIIQVYSSSVYQLRSGESIQGIEIKFDERSEVTGNFYFELEEKASDRSGEFVRSGILSPHHWLYVIGNKSEAFLFDSNRLRAFHSPPPPRTRKLIDVFPDDVALKTTTPPGYKNATSIGLIVSRSLILDKELYAKHILFDELSRAALKKMFLAIN